MNYKILVTYCVMAISKNNNCFLMGIARKLSQKEIIKLYQNIPIQPWQVHKKNFYDIHSEQIKRIRINLLMKQEIQATTVRTAFS